MVGMVSVETVCSSEQRWVLLWQKMPGWVTLETAQNKWWRGGGGDVCALIQVVLMENNVENNSAQIDDKIHLIEG